MSSDEGLKACPVQRPGCSMVQHVRKPIERVQCVGCGLSAPSVDVWNALPRALTPADTGVESDRFLIQRTGYYVGNSVVWWRPEGIGYTTKLDEAGRYSEDEAMKITRHPNCEDRAWPEADILAVATLHVDSQYMPRSASARAVRARAATDKGEE